MTQTCLIFDFDICTNGDPGDNFCDQEEVSPKTGFAASPLDLLMHHRRRGVSSDHHEEAEEWDVRLMHLISNSPHSPAADGQSVRLRPL